MADYSGAYKSQILTRQSLQHNNKDLGFIHEKIAPPIQVIKQSADILTYSADNLRIHNTLRAVGGGSFTVDFSTSVASAYKLEDHGVNTYIAQEDYDNSEKPINVQFDTVDILTEMLQVAKEYALSSVLQATGSYTNSITLAGADQWSESATSDPIDDIRTAIRTIKTANGKRANTIILAEDTMWYLIFHPQIKDLFPGASQITGDMLVNGLKMIFPGIKQVLNGGAVYNNANKGASVDITELWSKTCIVAYVELTPRLKSRTFATTYQKGSPREVIMLPWKKGSDKDLVDRKSDWIKISDEYDQVLVDETCGYLIDAAIA